MKQLTLQEKLQTLEQDLSNSLLERRAEIRTAILAMVSRKHHFQLGPPGSAKSALVTAIYKSVAGLEEGDVFAYLLSQFTTPEELFGPPSLKALEEDRYRRNTDLKLPEARLAFLDECWKAGSSLLNSLLSALNERIFYNDGKVIQIPLVSAFLASNELPQGEELNALYDRIHFKHVINYIRDPAAFRTMLTQQLKPPPVPHIHWQDIVIAQQTADEVEIPDEVIDSLVTLRERLSNDGMTVTDRKFAESLPIIQASAVLNGRTVADMDDMQPLKHVYWTREDEQKTVANHVLALANPVEQKAAQLLDDVETLVTTLRETIDADDGAKRIQSVAVEVYGKAKQARKEAKALAKQAAAAGRPASTLLELESRFEEIHRRLQDDVFKESRGETE